MIVCAGGTPDACVVALDRETGAERWRALRDRPAHSTPVAIDAGGRRQIVVWTADSVAALDPTAGTVLWQVPRKTTFDVAEVVASPVLHGNRLLCLGAWNRSSLLLQLTDGKPAPDVVWRSRQKPSTMMSTPIFSDDRRFYAVLMDGSFACLDADTGAEVWATTAPTGRRLGTAHLTRHGDRAFLFNQKGHLLLVRLSPERYEELGHCLLVEPTAGYRAQGPVAWAPPAFANRCVFARNDRELVCASLAAEQVVESTTREPATPARVLATDIDQVAALAFAPRGNALAVGSAYGAVRLIDAATGQDQPAPEKQGEGVCAVAFSPDGKYLASAGGSEFTPQRNGGKTLGHVQVWDTTTSKPLAELVGHESKVFSVAFASDGRTAATSAADQTVRIWEPATGKERAVLQGHAAAVWSVAFSPDGKTLASAGADGDVILWDVATGRERMRLEGHEDEVFCVAYSPDGKHLASGGADGTVRLWNSNGAGEPQVLRGHQGSVACLAFSPDAQTLASGGGDETVKLWNVADASLRRTLRGHRSRVVAVSFAPHEPTLATAGSDDSIRLWDLDAVVEP